MLNHTSSHERLVTERFNQADNNSLGCYFVNLPLATLTN